MAQANTDKKYTCQQCGAKVDFQPGTTELKCPYCAGITPIPQSAEEIQELDFRGFLDQAAHNAPALEAQIVKCGGCGADVTLKANVVHDSCPFCGHNLVN